jgi:hypothetical protein
VTALRGTERWNVVRLAQAVRLECTGLVLVRGVKAEGVL